MQWKSKRIDLLVKSQIINETGFDRTIDVTNISVFIHLIKVRFSFTIRYHNTILYWFIFDLMLDISMSSWFFSTSMCFFVLFSVELFNSKSGKPTVWWNWMTYYSNVVRTMEIKFFFSLSSFVALLLLCLLISTYSSVCVCVCLCTNELRIWNEKNVEKWSFGRLFQMIFLIHSTFQYFSPRNRIWSRLKRWSQ